MDVFSKELLRVGTLKGFKYFSCYLRGREELLVEIRKVRHTAADLDLYAPCMAPYGVPSNC